MCDKHALTIDINFIWNHRWLMSHESSHKIFTTQLLNNVGLIGKNWPVRKQFRSLMELNVAFELDWGLRFDSCCQIISLCNHSHRSILPFHKLPLIIQGPIAIEVSLAMPTGVSYSTYSSLFINVVYFDQRYWQTLTLDWDSIRNSVYTNHIKINQIMRMSRRFYCAKETTCTAVAILLHRMS